MLLEAYFVQIESTMNKLITLQEYIDDTEYYINIQLDNHRNQLIQCCWHAFFPHWSTYMCCLMTQSSCTNCSKYSHFSLTAATINGGHSLLPTCLCTMF
ncbi:uncharacterized protein [Nicotiana tomentosiformis]|uniref:uncharacterized protein isoform X3 n=1 Tax=Nicotiana tomentosiformis TaxID=4098 RepID=UPI00087871FD|nr:uncharacterized protein LOC104107830 isoform X5 [Nicotiana tomentosiformis]